MSDQNKATYPWAQLYDLESGGRPATRGQLSQGPGRPRNLVKRLKTSITLTDEEKRIYEKVNYTLVQQLHPNKVFKSQVLGLALRLLDANINALPPEVSSWEEVAENLFEMDQEHPE